MWAVNTCRARQQQQQQQDQGQNLVEVAYQLPQLPLRPSSIIDALTSPPIVSGGPDGILTSSAGSGKVPEQSLLSDHLDPLTAHRQLSMMQGVLLPLYDVQAICIGLHSLWGCIPCL